MPPPTDPIAIVRGREIAIGYRDGFLTNQVQVVESGLVELGGRALVNVFSWTDRDGAVRPGGYISRDLASGRLRCAFRGTEKRPEWESDLDVIPRKVPWNLDLLVHTGAYEIYDSARVPDGTQLVHYLMSITQPGEIVEFEGHSLGGGLCTIAAHHFATLRGIGKAECYPFCGMRVFDQAGALNMDMLVPQHIRQVVVGDAVPREPPEWLQPVGYFHAGIEMDYDPRGRIQMNPDPLALVDNEERLHNIGTVLFLMGYNELLLPECRPAA